MEAETLIKINNAVSQANQIALILPELTSLDELCAAISLKEKFKLEGKVSHIFSSSVKVPETLFFNNPERVFSDFNKSSDLIIKVKGQNVSPAQLRYEKHNEDLLVYITPKEGIFKESDVEVLPTIGKYDLLIILGAAALDQVGDLYKNNTEIFYSTPKISISNKIDQEYFSNITWVELESVSLCEQLAGWFGVETLSKQNDLINTALLAGIISETKSFRDPKTTPHCLSLAASLAKFGARQQDIIQYLFKTKPFNLLQLWGRALARIKTNSDKTLLYSVITKQDLEKTQTLPTDLPKVLEEIINMAGGYQIIALVVELSVGVEVLLAGQPHIKLKQLAHLLDSNFNGEIEPLLGNFKYIKIPLPNLQVGEIEQTISTLPITGI